MITLSRLRQDLEFNRSLGDIIDILKTAALIQFRIFQAKERPNPDFLEEVSDCFNLLKSRGFKSPYLSENPGMPSAIVVVTSDEGFLGELNSLLMNSLLDQRRSGDEMVVVGERGSRYLEEMNENFTSFPGISDDLNYGQVKALEKYLVSGYGKKFGRVVMVYPEFLSVTSQKVKVVQLLPHAFAEKVIKRDISYLVEDLLIEPSARAVMEALAGLWLGHSLLSIFWSSKQAEYSARIMHLEGSTQELSSLNQKLSFDYFRQAHALSDKTIREISASKIILQKNG